MRRKCVAALRFFVPLFLFSIIGALAGETDNPGKQTPRASIDNISGALTVEDALSLAERYNPALRAARASVAQAQAQVTTAKTRPNPTVTFGSLGRQQALLSAGIPGMLHGLNITQPVELPLERSTRIRAAETRSEGSRWSMAEVRLAIRGNVKRAFYEALRNKNAVGVARENLTLLEDLRRRIGVQVEVGEAARLELTRAEAEVAGARIQARSAELRLAGAMSSLAALIGTPLENIELDQRLPAAAALPGIDELRQRMLSRHPTIAVADTEVRRTEIEIQHERAQRLPQPNIWVDWFQQPEAAQYRFGVTIPIPVWNRREGPVAEAVAERQHAVAVAAQRRVQMNASLEQAFNVYEVASQQVAIFETGTLLQAEAAVRAAQAAFRYGERGIIEVLDAQRVLRSAQMDYLNARFDRQQALNELEQLGVMDTGATVP